MTTFPGKLRGIVDERDSVGVDRDLVRTMTIVRSNTQTEPALTGLMNLSAAPDCSHSGWVWSLAQL